MMFDKCSVKIETKMISVKSIRTRRVLTADKILWSFDDAVNPSQKLHEWALRVPFKYVRCHIRSGITARACG